MCPNKVGEITEDKFLGGRIVVCQPVRGFRAGLDAVMLAAAVPARAGDNLLELGAGGGTASLCVATRVPDCSIIGLEIDAELVALANDNARANGAKSVRFIAGDVFDPPPKLRREFDHVFCNPPFHGPGEVPPDASRARALHDAGALTAWIEAGLKRVASNGTFTVIIRADRVGDALRVMPDSGVTFFPLWPKQGEPAKRAILRVRKGSREPLSLLPGLVLHEGNGGYTSAADDVLRNTHPLDLG